MATYNGPPLRRMLTTKYVIETVKGDKLTTCAFDDYGTMDQTVGKVKAHADALRKKEYWLHHAPHIIGADQLVIRER